MSLVWARRRSRRELDAEEQAVARGPVAGPTRPGRPAPVVRLDVDERGAGPVPDATRATLERSLGMDLSGVRVRLADGGPARRGALAETAGHVVAFAPGAWSPDTEQGRRLVAHEVAHVFQSQEHGRTLASKPAAGAKPFHQEVIDRWNDSWGHHALAIKPILLLCEAVADERVKEVPALVDGLAKVEGHLLPPVFPSSKVAEELLTRLTLLGLPALTRRVLHWYVALPGVRDGRPGGRRYYDDEVWYWEEVVWRLRQRVDWRDGNASLRLIDALAGLIRQLDAERKSLDAQAVAEDTKRVIELAEALGGSDIGFETKPNISISRYFGRLAVMMRTAFVHAQAAVQAVMDVAAAELAARRPTALLDELDRRLVDLGTLTLPGTTAFDVNETIFEKRKGKDVLVQVDVFPDQPGAERRRIVLQGYDVTTEGLFLRPDQEIAPGRILAIRRRQIEVLRRVYGVETDKGKLTPEAVENAQALQAVGGDGLQLGDDDDWRRLLSAKFEAHLARTGSVAESFDAVIELVKVYLRAFTIHSPMNIDDFGDNQLRAQFPRALTGQLVHDCGVYALRITYMLSLLRDHPRLRLQLRFVQLPVHIGLVITSAAAPIGAYLVHNDAFTKYTDADIDALRKRWLATDEQGEPRRPVAPTKATEDQFLAELAADAFVPLTDIPYVISAVPDLSGRSPADRDALWRAYQRTLGTRLFGKVTQDEKSPLFQFHLRYLKLLELIKRHHNTFLVPFWNEVGHVAWRASKAAIEQASARQTAAATPEARQAADAAFARARDTYLRSDVTRRGLSVADAFTKVFDSFQPVTDEAIAVSLELQQHPEIVGAGARRASSDRMLTIFDPFTDPWWARDVKAHLRDLGAGIVTPPPYAEVKNLLGIVD
jgi:hypothetical protein